MCFKIFFFLFNRHGSDEEEVSPHKKKKKKNKERKHADDVPPPSHMPQEIRKQQAPKPSKAEPHLYEPDSPTSTHRSDSPEGKSLTIEIFFMPFG